MTSSNASQKPYRVNQVDLAGNDFQIFQAATFGLACEQLLTAKKMRPDSIFYIINSDLADYDSDGLTDEEREQHP
jgi:hypothetical protein